MNMQVELLSNPINFAVVQLPQRNFPGVVFQGDTLHSLVSNINEMIVLLREKQLEDLMVGLEDMKEQLSSALVYYESVCKNKEISLPY